jgi:hypothetical protein
LLPHAGVDSMGWSWGDLNWSVIQFEKSGVHVDTDRCTVRVLFTFTTTEMSPVKFLTKRLNANTNALSGTPKLFFVMDTVNCTPILCTAVSNFWFKFFVWLCLVWPIETSRSATACKASSRLCVRLRLHATSLHIFSKSKHVISGKRLV